PGRRWNEREPASKQNGNDRDLDGIDEALLVQAAKERRTAEQPDVLARVGLDTGDCEAGYFPYPRDPWRGVLQRAREDEGSGAGRQRGRTRRAHELEGPAADQVGVELSEYGLKVRRGITDDPVGLAVGAGDIAVETHRDAIADARHEGPVLTDSRSVSK